MGLKMIGGSSSTGGGGTVTFVDSLCPIVVDNSDPTRPIITLENTRDTAANILAREIIGDLCDGEFYTITDMPFPLTEATFRAKFDVNVSQAILENNGAGIDDADNQYLVNYNLVDNVILYLYLPAFNQTARRLLGSVSNNIEAIHWADVNWLNIDINEGIFANIHSTFIFNNIRMSGGGVDGGNHTGVNISFSDLFGAALTAILNNTTAYNLNIEDGGLTLSTSVSNYTQEPQSVVDCNGFIVDSVTVGPDMNITLQGNALNVQISQTFSTAIVSISASANFAAGTLTIPNLCLYAGIIILTNAAGGNISKINIITSNWYARTYTIQNANGVTNTFVPTLVGIAATDNIVKSTAGNIVVVGRTNGGDLFQWQRGGNFNVVVNSVVNI